MDLVYNLLIDYIDDFLIQQQQLRYTDIPPTLKLTPQPKLNDIIYCKNISNKKLIYIRQTKLYTMFYIVHPNNKEYILSIRNNDLSLIGYIIDIDNYYEQLIVN